MAACPAESNMPTKRPLPAILRLPVELRLRIAELVYDPDSVVGDLTENCCAASYVLESKWRHSSPLLKIAGFRELPQAYPQSFVPSPLVLVWESETSTESGRARFMPKTLCMGFKGHASDVYGIRPPKEVEVLQQLGIQHESLLPGAKVLACLTCFTICAEDYSLYYFAQLALFGRPSDREDVLDDSIHDRAGYATKIHLPTLRKITRIMHLHQPLDVFSKSLALQPWRSMHFTDDSFEPAFREIAYQVDRTWGHWDATLPNLSCQNFVITYQGISYEMVADRTAITKQWIVSGPYFDPPVTRGAMLSKISGAYFNPYPDRGFINSSMFCGANRHDDIAETIGFCAESMCWAIPPGVIVWAIIQPVCSYLIRLIGPVAQMSGNISDDTLEGIAQQFFFNVFMMMWALMLDFMADCVDSACRQHACERRSEMLQTAERFVWMAGSWHYRVSQARAVFRLLCLLVELLHEGVLLLWRLLAV